MFLVCCYSPNSSKLGSSDGTAVESVTLGAVQQSTFIFILSGRSKASFEMFKSLSL